MKGSNLILVFDSISISDSVKVGGKSASLGEMCNQLTSNGIGLKRIEFAKSNSIRIHPLALIAPENIVDGHNTSKIDQLTACYTVGKRYFIDKLTKFLAEAGIDSRYFNL